MTKKSHKDFLMDNKFVYWRLTRDPVYCIYWKDFIKDNPELKEEFEKAISESNKIKLGNEKLTEDECHRLLDKIHISVSNAKQKRLFYQFTGIAAAACITFLMVISFFYILDRKDEKNPVANNIIVGENLDEEDIYLITDFETTSFSQDIIVKIDKKGLTTVQELKGEKTIRIDTEKTEMNKLIVPYGKRSQLELSDGSKVWINSGSILEFPSSFGGKTREINISGEMYIEVAKDNIRPFYVNTQDFQIKVYGTKFNISSFVGMNTQSIVLVEGSVSVKVALQEETFMVPDEMLIIRNHTVEKNKVDVTKYITWKDGYLQTEKTSIDEVLRQIERYYNLSFNIEEELDLSSKTCSGKIYLSESLDNVLQTIALLSSTQYTRDDKKIYINVNP
jgi:hypothetical protein